MVKMEHHYSLVKSTISSFCCKVIWNFWFHCSCITGGLELVQQPQSCVSNLQDRKRYRTLWLAEVTQARHHHQRESRNMKTTSGSTKIYVCPDVQVQLELLLHSWWFSMMIVVVKVSFCAEKFLWIISSDLWSVLSILGAVAESAAQRQGTAGGERKKKVRRMAELYLQQSPWSHQRMAVCVLLSVSLPASDRRDISYISPTQNSMVL